MRSRVLLPPPYVWAILRRLRVDVVSLLMLAILAGGPACSSSSTPDRRRSDPDTSIRRLPPTADIGVSSSDGGLSIDGTGGDTDVAVDVPSIPNQFEAERAAAGGDHTCAIKRDGTMWCWGDNEVGQLGDGTTRTRQQPIRVGDASDWTMVVAGAGYSCGLRQQTLWCWGKGEAYIDAGRTPTRVSEELESRDEFPSMATVSGSETHICSITPKGTVWCWGKRTADGVGERREGTHPGRPAPTTRFDDWQSVDAGGNHTCAIRDDDTLWCWGDNENGELGSGTARGVRSKAKEVDASAPWSEVSAGGDHTCAIKGNGTLWCWGASDAGQLGFEPVGGGGSISSPTQVGERADWASVSAGTDYTCATRQSGRLVCWGRQALGQTGTGSTENSIPNPTPVLAPVSWRRVTTGERHGCAIATSGRIYCWGYNQFGQLGETDGLERTPDPIEPDVEWRDAMAAETFSCGIRSDRSLACWGSNRYGQIGDSDIERARHPTEIGDGTDWDSVGGGRRHACARNQSGRASCWGRNQVGQLGTPPLSNNIVYTPKAVSGIDNWSSLSVGRFHNCGLDGDDFLYCWGQNGGGRLGDGSSAIRAEPRPITSETKWDRVEAGGQSTCGLQSNGGLYCWGSNRFGQIATSLETTQVLSPEQVGTRTNWRDVGVGKQHACGVRTNGTLWCWGHNKFSQLGLGAGESSEPERERIAKLREVGLSTTWKKVAAGSRHTCAIRENGTLWCWGSNRRGQLGLASETTSKRQVDAPTRIRGNQTWTEVFPGTFHTCAMDASQTLYCWGSNEFGQLGNDNAWKIAPVPVVDPEK